MPYLIPQHVPYRLAALSNISHVRWTWLHTFSVGRALPALAALYNKMQCISDILAHDLVVKLLCHILIAESEARVGLEEHILPAL